MNPGRALGDATHRAERHRGHDPMAVRADPGRPDPHVPLLVQQDVMQADPQGQQSQRRRGEVDGTAVKPSSASLRSGRRSHATATGNSMSNWPVAGTATADASTPPFVSDVASLGTSEPATTGPSSSAHAAPGAAPARNMTAVGTAKRASHGAISYR
jgi:hypothetical protein